MVTLILAKHGHARQPSSPSGHRKSYQRLGIGCADCGIPPDTNGNLARNHAPRDLPAARGGRDENGQNTVNARTPLRPRMRRDVGNPLPRSGRGRGGREAPKISRILCLTYTPAGSAGPSSIRVVNTLYLRQKWRPRGGARARQNYGRPYPRSTPGNRGCQMPPNTWEIRPGEQGHDREIQYRKSWPTLAAAATAAGTSGLQGRIDANWHYAPSIPRPVRGRNSLNPGQSRDARGAQRVANNSSGDEPRLDAGAASPGRSNIAAKRGEAARHLHKWERVNLRLYSEGTWGI